MHGSSEETSSPSGSATGVSRRALLAGIGGAGILVTALDPLGMMSTAGATAATQSAAPSSGSIEIRLSSIKVRRLFDEARQPAGFVLEARVIDSNGSETGSFTGTRLAGDLMVHETVVGGSSLLAMGSGTTYAVIGSTGAFAGATGGYVLELDPEGVGDRTTGRILVQRTGDQR